MALHLRKAPQFGLMAMILPALVSLQVSSSTAQTFPPPPIDVSPDFREDNFGTIDGRFSVGRVMATIWSHYNIKYSKTVGRRYLAQQALLAIEIYEQEDWIVLPTGHHWQEPPDLEGIKISLEGFDEVDCSLKNFVPVPNSRGFRIGGSISTNPATFIGSGLTFSTFAGSDDIEIEKAPITRNQEGIPRMEWQVDLDDFSDFVQAPVALSLNFMVIWDCDTSDFSSLDIESKIAFEFELDSAYLNETYKYANGEVLKCSFLGDEKDGTCEVFDWLDDS